MNNQGQKQRFDFGSLDDTYVPVGLASTSRNSLLGRSSRLLIKVVFTNAETFVFPKGHPTVAFTEDQISSILKVVADETVRASCSAMENLIQKASELNLGSRSNRNVTPSRLDCRSTGRTGSVTSGYLSDTRGAIRTDDDFSSIGYSYETEGMTPINLPPRGDDVPSCSYDAHQSDLANDGADSPGWQTLAALKAEALQDQDRITRRSRSKPTAGSSGSKDRRRVTRSCKIMKEACFKGMELTRTFVSGPVDSRWNKYKLYCQICKANISIYGKGAREILRHHSTEKHLKKDQR